MMRRATGFDLNDRMRSMGIIGMVLLLDGWHATFTSYPDAQFLLPLPVAEWLLSGTAD